MSSSLVDPADMTKLARALVNPDKSVRDKTCFNLTSFFSATTSFTDMEMLKLWKALYYCMWLSDKNEIQTELAAFLCSVVDDFPNTEIRLLYVRMFFRTMLREWSLLDQHRLNKFYRLLRFMLRKIFMLLRDHKFSSKMTKLVLEVLDDEVFNKVPNGVRFHLFDVFLEELYAATDGNISTSVMVTLFTPLLKLLSLSRDASCQDRVSKIFTSYLSTFAAENKISLKTDSAESGGAASPIFSKVDTKALQALVFSIASDASTLDANRTKLYGVHKQFAAKTGMAFVEESVLLKFTSASSVEELVDPEPISTPEPEQSKKASGKKRVVPPSDTIVKESVKNSTKPAAPTNDDAPATKKKLKVSTDESAMSTTIGVAVKKAELKNNNSGSSANSEDTSKVAEKSPDFIQSKKFEGAKPGYAFKKGNQGMGYYIDPVQLKNLQSVQSKKGAKKPSDAADAAPVGKKAKVVDSSSNPPSGPPSPPSSSKKHVSFGKLHKRDYVSSVRGLQSSSPVDVLDRSPVKSAIKMTRSASKK